MFKLEFHDAIPKPDFFLVMLCVINMIFIYISMISFSENITISILQNFSITFSVCLIPYAFLYPIAFIMFRIYGPTHANIMIVASLIGVAITILFLILLLHLSNHNSVTAIWIESLFHTSKGMYIVGFVAMPLGIYSSFFMLNILARLKMGLNVVTLFLSSSFGEVINTILVYPLGSNAKNAEHAIFNTIIADTLIFKIIAAIILSFLTMMVISFIRNTEK